MANIIDSTERGLQVDRPTPAVPERVDTPASKGHQMDDVAQPFQQNWGPTTQTVTNVAKPIVSKLGLPGAVVGAVMPDQVNVLNDAGRAKAAIEAEAKATPVAEPPEAAALNAERLAKEAEATETDSTVPGDPTTDAAKSLAPTTVPGADAMASAQELALAQQAGAVNSAVGGARAAGMSPAQAALMGAASGSSTYSDSLAKNYQSANQQRIMESLGLLSDETARRGQDVTSNLGTQANTNQANQSLWNMIFGGAGSALQAASPYFTQPAYAEGTDSAPTDSFVVGEHGPELVVGGKGAKVIPISDGHDMMAYTLKHLAASAPRRAEAPKPAPTLRDMKPALDQAMSYIVKGGK